MAPRSRSEAWRARRAAEEAWTRFVEHRSAVGVSPTLSASWRRSAAAVDPDVARAPVDAGSVATEWRRSRLHDPVATMRAELEAIVDAGDFVLAVTDERAKILHTIGSRWMRGRAEQVGFVPGGHWDEGSMGTNAPALSVVTARPHAVFSAEHFSLAVHDWVCYSAPVLDPATGRAVGVVDLSTTWDRANPLALSTAMMLGRALGELLPPATAPVPTLELAVLGRRRVAVDGREVALTRRQVELLAVLALHPQGLSLDGLHARVYHDRSVSPTTCKAEVSHLRRLLGGGIGSRPYRLLWPVRSDLQTVRDALRAGDVAAAVAAYGGPLLPDSEAPELVDQRVYLEAALREAVLGRRDPDLLLRLGEHLPHDLELHEQAAALLPRSDPRHAIATARARTAWR